MKKSYLKVAVMAVFAGAMMTGYGSASNSDAPKHPAEPEMVFVEGGTFRMGGWSEKDKESPLPRVTVSNFSIGKYEVTQAQWKLIMGSNPSYLKGDNLPVVDVSWTDAQEFISRLNAATGKQYRLPTEAEWEYAARGGNKSQNYKYSGSHNLKKVGWFYDNSSGKIHPVGTKLANELGIYDMSGNVWEWCQDWHIEGSARVFLGGSWRSGVMGCRVSGRGSNTPDDRGNNLGFRLVLPL